MRHDPILRRTSLAAHRRGIVTLLLILSLSVLLGALALALDPSLLVTVRGEAQNAADAAALAGAQALASDDLLRNDPSLLPPLLQHAASQAAAYAQDNLVNGRPLLLQPNPSNQTGGDIVLGTVPAPTIKQFIAPGDLLDPSPTLASVNAVRITARLTRARGNAPALLFGLNPADVQAVATAMRDNAVIGFRPLFQQPLFLAPLALLSDAAGNNRRSWDYQVNKRHGQDRFTFNGQRFTAGGDRIHEFQAVLAVGARRAAAANVVLLYFDQRDVAAVNQQLGSGLQPSQLRNFQGQFILDANNRRIVPGAARLLPAGNRNQSAHQLWNTLNDLQQNAAVRIWPLYSAIDGSGQVTVTGFVAARVAYLTAFAPGQPLQFVLQPTVVTTGMAVTATDQPAARQPSVANPFICKVRLVE